SNDSETPVLRREQPRGQLLLECEWNREVRNDSSSHVKVGGQHADDRSGQDAVEENPLSDSCRVLCESPRPKSVADNDRRFGRGQVIGWTKGSPRESRPPEGLEVVARYQLRRDFIAVSVDGRVGVHVCKRRDIGKSTGGLEGLEQLPGKPRARHGDDLVFTG